jgi:hypothetical protein
VTPLGWVTLWFTTAITAAIGAGAVGHSLWHDRRAPPPDVTEQCSLCEWEDVPVMDGTIRQPVPCPAHQDRRHAR